MRLITVIFFLHVALVVGVLGQTAGSTSGAISGLIKDQQGAAVAGAKVYLSSEATGVRRVIEASEQGIFDLLRLVPGQYEIRVEQEGFEPQSTSIRVSLGVTLLLEFTLKPSGVEEAVVVTSGDRSRTESSRNIERELIEQLPINIRSFLDFSLTSARVVRDRLPAVGVSATTGLSFNGQQGRYNNLTIDGLDNNDRSSGSARSVYSQEAVAEFQLVSDGYTAEFGRALGGIVNIVTRGGTNESHGTAFYLNRNDKTSARDVFNTIRPQYAQHQGGGVIGGPIRKDKAFYFGSFERLSIKQNEIVTISDTTLKSIQRRYSLSNGAIPFSVGSTTLLGRLDLNLSDRGAFWLRYDGGFTYNGAFEPFGGLVGGSSAGMQRLNDNTIASSYSIISPSLNLVNETRVAFNRRDQSVVSADPGPRVTLTAPEGRIIFGRFENAPQERLAHNLNLVNITTLVQGSHQIKFGGDLFHLKALKGRNSLPSFAAGNYVFEPINFAIALQQPGLPILTALEAFDPTLRTTAQKRFLRQLSPLLPAAFPGLPQIDISELPIPMNYVQGFGDPVLRSNRGETLVSAFLQDDYLRDNVLLKLGLRYDYVNISRYPVASTLSPRLGLAWNLKNIRLRANYGIFTAPPIAGPLLLEELTNVQNYRILTAPFPYSLLAVLAPGGSLPESSELPAGVPFIPQLSSVVSIDRNLALAYTQQAGLGVDLKIGTGTLAATYNYVRGVRLYAVRNINPVVRPILSDPFQSRIQGRVDPTRGEVLEIESAFDSYYHAFTAIYSGKLSEKLQLQVSYTLSKALDNVLPFASRDRQIIDSPQDSLKPGLERGFSIQDVRHRLVVSGLWNLDYRPIFKGLTLSFISTVNSGRPYNLISGVDLNRNGDDGDRPLAIARNAGVAPGFASLDLRLQHSTQLRDSLRLQLFAEAFNLFNHTNIDPNKIDRVYAPDSAGRFDLPMQRGSRYLLTPDRYRGAFAPRQVQLGMRLSF